MTSIICRALHITNLSVNVLPGSSLTLGHSHAQSGFRSNCSDTLIVQLSVNFCIQKLSFNLAGGRI